jgi:hypothetical protein
MITNIQLDPNGFCNSKCWFCPVAYEPNPEFAKSDMPIEMLENIVKQLSAGIGDYISTNFIYTAHYNEVLLYKHFEEMLEVFRKYNMTTMVLTNGVPLTKSKVDIINKYRDVVLAIHFNIPSHEAEKWSEYTKMNKGVFNRILQNIEYAMETLPHLVDRGHISLGINNLDTDSLKASDGMAQPLENAPSIDFTKDFGDLTQAINFYKTTFPGMNVSGTNMLVDRAGYLSKKKVLSNKHQVLLNRGNGSKVIGCRNMGDRATGWIHINAIGDMFLCCDDYSFDTVFGNVCNKTIKDLYLSDEKQKMIEKMRSTLCINCVDAIWDKVE